MNVRPSNAGGSHWFGNLLLTVASLNLAAVMLSGGYSLPLGFFAFRSHSVFRSALAVCALVAWRQLWPRRHEFAADRLWKVCVANWVPIALGLIVAGGTFLRFWGLSAGLPGIPHPDEPHVVGTAIEMLQRSSLDPRWYHYPPFFMILLLPSFALYYVVAGHAFWGTLAEIPTQAPGFYHIARLHTAAFSAATIWLTYVLTRRVASDRAGQWAGLIAAALVAVSFNSVRSSHEAVTDAPLAAMTTIALIAIATMLQKSRRRDYVLAGLAVGLACSTKYTATALLAPLLLAHLLARPPARWLSLDAAIGAAAMPVGFLIGSPAVLFDWHIFLEHLGFMASFAHGATREVVLDRLGLIVKYAFESGFGTAGTIAATSALVVALHRRRPEELLLVAFVVLAVASMTNATHRWFPRYLVPIYPPVYALVGLLLVRAATLIHRQWTIRPIHLAIVVLAVTAIIAAPQLRESLSYSAAHAAESATTGWSLWGHGR